MPSEIDKPFVDGFAATSVLLALITVLFGVRYPEITTALTDPEPAGQVAKNNYRRRLRAVFWAKLFPVLALSWAFALLPLPGSVQIVREIDGVASHYDFIRAAWIATDVAMLYFAGWTAWFAVGLIGKIKSAGPIEQE